MSLILNNWALMRLTGTTLAVVGMLNQMQQRCIKENVDFCTFCYMIGSLNSHNRHLDLFLLQHVL